MLAGTLSDPCSATFPCMVTPKIDGVRVLIRDGAAVTRQLKPVRNYEVGRLLSSLLPEGSDGEVYVDTGFASTSSLVMSREGHGHFTYYWFDLLGPDLSEPYSARMRQLENYLTGHPELMNHPDFTVVPLLPHIVTNAAELAAFEKEVLAAGHEGVMVRAPDGPYKCGRSTVREGILLKLKRFDDSEARIDGCEELLHNGNDKVGRKRTSHKVGMVPAGCLGALSVTDVRTGVAFRVGSGFTAVQRSDLWRARSALVGKVIKYRHFGSGGHAPRFPTYVGFRDADDM